MISTLEQRDVARAQRDEAIAEADDAVNQRDAALEAKERYAQQFQELTMLTLQQRVTPLADEPTSEAHAAALAELDTLREAIYDRFNDDGTPRHGGAGAHWFKSFKSPLFKSIYTDAEARRKQRKDIELKELREHKRKLVCE